MSTLSSKALWTALNTYIAAPTNNNRQALIAAADEYHEHWVLDKSTDNAATIKVSGARAKKPKFDLSRIMDDLQTASA